MIAVYLNWKLPSYRPLFDNVGIPDEPDEKNRKKNEN